MKPEYEPRTPGQAFGYLTEECGETLAALGKLLRWGPESVNPEIPEAERETNADWLRRELDDLTGAIRRAQIALLAPEALPLSVPPDVDDVVTRGTQAAVCSLKHELERLRKLNGELREECGRLRAEARVRETFPRVEVSGG